MKQANLRAFIAVTCICLFCALNTSVYAAEPAQPAKESAAKETRKDYPSIVLYSTSWCTHCKQAREYFAAKKIPYVNRDVEQDEQAEKLLTNTYKSQGVPVVVIGTGANEVVLRGFSPPRFEDALKKAQAKK